MKIGEDRRDPDTGRMGTAIGPLSLSTACRRFRIAFDNITEMQTWLLALAAGIRCGPALLVHSYSMRTALSSLRHLPCQGGA